MCTAATYKTEDHYFGRTLDYEISYHEAVTITPRNYPFHFRKGTDLATHYAMIGMAAVEKDYPLYFDAVNEKGVGMAGLNFPGNAFYREEMPGKDNIATFEFIPWILGQCADVSEAKKLLADINLTNVTFSEKLPAASLHWIVSDRNASITVESVKEGVKIYDNPVGILTNNPPFEMQMFYLNNYMKLSNQEPENQFSNALALTAYSRGMGAVGMPGDLSSASRFVRAVFTKFNSVSGSSESESISQFFHILGAVAQQRGCVQLKGGEYEITLYTSCCNTDKGIYYYTTYENHQISAVDMYKEDLEGRTLSVYQLVKGQQINWQNGCRNS